MATMHGSDIAHRGMAVHQSTTNHGQCSACWPLLPAAQARADVPLLGPDSNDGSYSTAKLSGVATGGDTVSSGGLIGVSLWGLLGGANSASSTSPTYGDITTQHAKWR